MGGDWVWYLGAGVLGVGAVSLFAWAWWGDRSRGSARCGRCWYSLDALVGVGEGVALPVCPECGWKGKKRGTYFRPRRRRAWACAAFLIALGAAVCGVTPKARRDGVWSIAPTWAMWGVVRTGYIPQHDFLGQLAERSEDNQAGAAQRLYAWAPEVWMTRAAWVNGVPVRGKTMVVPAGQQLEAAGFVFCRDRDAVNDADVESSQSHENWWQPRARVWSPSDSGGQRIFVGSLSCQVLPLRTAAGEQLVTFDVRVPLKDSIDEVMRPVALERETVLGALKPSLFVLPTTRNLAVSVSDVQSFGAGLSGVALGIKVELVRKGAVVARGRWYQSSAGATMSGRPVLVRFGPYDPEGNKNGPMTGSLEDLLADACVVRFSTDVEMALSALECDKYWKGSFEVPLAELVK